MLCGDKFFSARVTSNGIKEGGLVKIKGDCSLESATAVIAITNNDKCILAGKHGQTFEATALEPIHFH